MLLLPLLLLLLFLIAMNDNRLCNYLQLAHVIIAHFSSLSSSSSSSFIHSHLFIHSLIHSLIVLLVASSLTSFIPLCSRLFAID